MPPSSACTVTSLCLPWAHLQRATVRGDQHVFALHCSVWRVATTDEKQGECTVWCMLAAGCGSVRGCLHGKHYSKSFCCCCCCNHLCCCCRCHTQCRTCSWCDGEFVGSVIECLHSRLLHLQHNAFRCGTARYDDQCQPATVLHGRSKRRLSDMFSPPHENTPHHAGSLTALSSLLHRCTCT